MVAALELQANPAVEAIAEALVYPLTAGMTENFRASVAKLRFLVRLSFDRSPVSRADLRGERGAVPAPAPAALPQLDAGTLTRRWLFAADLVQHALANALEVHLAVPSGTGAPTATAAGALPA